MGEVARCVFRRWNPTSEWKLCILLTSSSSTSWRLLTTNQWPSSLSNALITTSWHVQAYQPTAADALSMLAQERDLGWKCFGQQKRSPRFPYHHHRSAWRSPLIRQLARIFFFFWETAAGSIWTAAWCHLLKVAQPNLLMKAQLSGFANKIKAQEFSHCRIG